MTSMTWLGRTSTIFDVEAATPTASTLTVTVPEMSAGSTSENGRWGGIGPFTATIASAMRCGVWVGSRTVTSRPYTIDRGGSALTVTLSTLRPGAQPTANK